MTCAGLPRPGDRARYVAACAAADNPDDVMDRATAAFRAMATAAAARNQKGVAEHADAVVDLTLQLCAAPAASTRAAKNKIRFLFLIADWLARRRPATAALLSAARDCELAIWGEEAVGTG